MDFYSKFSEYYDYIFPFQKPQYSFLRELIQPKDSVLDLACGTGNYIIELTKEIDIKGTGIDLDKDMVNKAKIKGADINNLNLAQKNMLDISSLNDQFDLIYCIGNSLPHLVDTELIKEMIQKIYIKLKNEGNLVLQIVNYDRRPQSLKTIINNQKNISFVRNYKYKGDIVEFHTKLIGEDFEVEGMVELYPLLSQELTKILVEAGFREVTLYGSFNKETYDPEKSSSLVVLCKK